ncbi:MAG: glycosyltransferase family 39 protein [Planctomycetes bacterium]|nr:glycosyltransferase family 39 protein [Planctomycetota bacterium]
MPRPLLLLLALALLLRSIALDFGLDFERPERALLQHQTDERGMVDSVCTAFLKGDFDPGDFLYRGPACFFLFGAADSATLAVRALVHGSSFAAERAIVDANPSLLHLIHRLVAAAASLLTVWVVGRFVRREWGERCGWIAMACAACAYLNVREAHFGTVDAVWGLTTALALDGIFRYATSGRARDACFAAAWAGAAGAVRYFGALACVLLAVAHVVAIARARREARTPPPFRRLVLAACVSIGAFLVCAPNVVYDLPTFIDKLRFSAQTFVESEDERGRLGVAEFHAVNTIGAGLGETIALAALAGVVIAWRMRGNARLLVVAALGLLPSLFAVAYSPVRFGVGPAIALIPLAAIAIDAVTRNRSARVAAAVTLVALAPSLVRDAAFLNAIARVDTRMELLDALERFGAKRQDVVAVGHYGLPFGHGWFDLYEALRNQSIESGQVWLREFVNARPRFVILDRTSGYPESLFLDTYGEAWTAVRRLWETEYHPVFEIDPRRDPPEPVLPDQTSGTPHFLMHFREPWSMSRTGGSLVLLELNAAP